ncbi:MAG: hypothetical protein ABWZ30_02145, partial [Jiangellaceae bacterium]
MIGDRRYRSDAVENRAQDPWHRVTRGGEASTARVSGLDLADAGQDLPAHAARRIVNSHLIGGIAVRRENGGRDGLGVDWYSTRDRETGSVLALARGGADRLGH